MSHSEPFSAARVVLEILDHIGMRYQDPAIEVRGSSEKPFYQIRPVVPVLTNGKVKRIRKTYHLGFCKETSLTEARRKKQLVMAGINGGTVVIAAQIPMANLIKQFRESYIPGLNETTQAKYTSLLKNHIDPDLGGLRLGEVDKPFIEAWLLSKKALSEAMRTDLRNLLASLFARAIEWKMWDGANPAHGARVGGGGVVREHRYVSDDQMAAFLDAIPASHLLSSFVARTLAMVSLFGGLRPSEALGLQWDDVDFERQTVTVRRRISHGFVGVPKTKKSARTTVVGDVVETLRILRPADPVTRWVFVREGGEMPPDDRDLQKYHWKPAAAAVGIYVKGFGPHQLRRMSTTLQQQCGATAVEAMRKLGHTRMATTLNYTLQDQDRERVVVEAMKDRLEAGTGLNWSRGDRKPVSC
jgi:integrase